MERVTYQKHLNSKEDADKEILSNHIVFVNSAEIISIVVRNYNNIKIFVLMGKNIN